MEWILRSPQIHSTFGSLGYGHGDGYHVNENCNEALANILHNLLNEDKYLRTYRRNISFGQNIQKDIIPLLIHAKEGKTIELLISILVNLTIPVECLLSVNVIDKTVFGRHAIFEITNLLTSTKEAFTDHRVTKVVVEFLKKNLDFEKPVSLTPEQCTNTGNGLLLLRNILHIPELETAAGTHTKQNQILWNIFSQSIDKVLIKLMTIPEANNWSVPMVQLVALMYKDQHAATQHKLLNFWLEASQSESSEDNESNTSPPDRGDSEDSSLMLTSDPTSDSSNTSEEITGWGQGNTDDAQPANSTQSPQAPGPTSAQLPAQPPPSQNPPPPVAQPPPAKPPPAQPPPTQPPPAQPPPALPPPPPPPLNPQADHAKSAPKSPKAPGNPVITESIATKRQLNYSASSSSGVDNGQSGSSSPKQFVSSDSQKKESMTSETSGYGTQLEQETISTSSNEDEPPKPLKPHHPKHKANTKTRIGGTASERKRKKIVKRSKGTIINVQGLSWKIPTDEDIAHVLKEFTVDFLLKGYNALVQTLHNQILTDPTLEIDTSHFFWLVTYFLKFATQIELSLENVSSVLSFDIAAYLAAEGVHLCEEFELVKKIHGGDLKPYIRRMHLVVTAIREFVLAIEVYQKQSLYTDENKDAFQQLQIKLCEMEELRLLMVLLLKHYNPIYHNKQYLQDLIITNHFLLIFVDNILRQPHYKGKTNMVDQVKQFATPEMMYQYALLLEDYKENGEFVNDCIFTLMHHVGGELESLIALYQPKILKIFTAIWKTEFEICDDWSDLIEYVINTFIKRPNSLLSARSVCLDAESFEDESFVPPAPADQPRNYVERKKPDSHYDSSEDMWTDTELSSLSWNFMQCNMDKDVIGEIVKLFKEDGVVKSRESVIKELHKQNLISQAEADSMLKTENDTNSKTHQQTKDSRNNDISKLCELLIQDGKSKFLEWMQKVLLDTCFAKIYLEKKAAESPCSQLKFECFKKKHVDLPQISPVAYHCLLKNMSVPLVPWNFDQATICKDLKFLRLVHKLGFHMPVDTGKLFIRIPHSWTADILYDVAGKIMPIDTSKLKFSKNDISVGTALTQTQTNTFTLSADVMKEDVTLTSSSEIYYRIHKQDHHATMVNFTPMPGISFEEGVTGSTEALKRNWLEVVQRSQELKITLQVKNEVKIKSSGRVLGGDARIFVPPLPSLCALTVTAHPHPQRSLPLPGFVARDDDETMMEDEDNSLCETASVASDLTRMYVSDEDEKLDLLLPNMEVEPGLLAIDDATSDSDS